MTFLLVKYSLSLEGALLSVSRNSGAFQVGIGGNITHTALTVGASGWLDVRIERESSGCRLDLDAGSSGQEADSNINLSGAVDACVTGAGSRTASLSFAAYGAQREVALQWTTNSTDRNDHYVIEKSVDGENFEELAMIENTVFGGDMEAFTQVDATPLLGDNYYRVKQAYMDGTFDYTSTELVNFNIDLEKLDVYPNPATDELFINMKPFIGKQAHILLSNQYGQVVREVKIDEVDAAPVRIETNNMSNGLYMLTIQPSNVRRGISKKEVVGRLY